MKPHEMGSYTPLDLLAAVTFFEAQYAGDE